jgi:two-component system, OmpR family, sensor histidine kinase ArlS
MIMPVRLRITLLFVALDIFIIGVVCGAVYYFFYAARENTIKTRLTNRAITTGRLLGQKEIFDQNLVRRIDSLTTIALKNKAVQAYDYQNRKIYSYSDIPGDTLQIDKDILDDAKVNQMGFFSIDDKEVVAYHYTDTDTRIVVVSAAEDVEGKENLHVLKNILLFAFLAGNAIVLIAGYLFSTRLLRPIRKITADVKEISAQNLSRRIETGKSKDEWYQMADTLNDLLNRLQESFELQRRFISNASHELSTPLTSISSQLEVAFQREREAVDYKKTMQSIYQDVRHMSKLTRTLLEFAKASGNAGGLDIMLIRVDEVVLRLPSEVAKINAEYSVLLQFDNLPENEENLLVFGNEELLFTAVKNIVINACKYSDNRQAIIRLEVDQKRIAISITDQGKGIPEKELRTIFQPFYRIEKSASGEGFGLGLSLAERIIKLHKGSIEVTSKQNVGTHFIINLPTARSLGG